MEYPSFTTIKEKIERELDLETEDFIQPEEFKSYVNDAINIAEQAIHKLGLEDEYFLSRGNISLVTNQEDYNLPADIYSNKIKRITYINGSTIFDVRRLRGHTRFEDAARISVYNTITDYYRYWIRNDSSATKPVIQLIPKSRETVSNVLEIWYYRTARKWTDDDSALCDLPESALQFLYAYVRYRCYDKEGHPNSQEAKEQMQQTRQDMIDVLSNMVPDEDSEMDKDLSIYQDMT